MREVILLGGYGSAGRVCFRELLQRSRAKIIIAGRNVQRADQLALAYGDRARGTYGNADDARTLQNLIPGAAGVIACCGGPTPAALEVAVQSRVPFIGLSPTPLDAHTLKIVSEQAWKAQVPVVLHAGAIPGLPGVLAELAVRRFWSLNSIQIASTGPWVETQTAQAEVEALAAAVQNRTQGHEIQPRPRRRPLRVRFPDPIRTRWVRATDSLDLLGFSDSHCVESVVYSEPDLGVVARGVQHILGRNHERMFALVAEAYPNGSLRQPALRVELQAPDTLLAASAAIGTLVEVMLAGKLPPGVLYPREALNPRWFLSGLEKRGVRVSVTQPGAS